MKISAFGDVVSQTAGSTPPLHSYTGQLWDADADLMYYRARWYDPTLGRFVSEDPMGFEAGDANLSRYVGNSTPNSTDPTGLDGMDIKMKYRELARKRTPDPENGLRPNDKPIIFPTGEGTEGLKSTTQKRYGMPKIAPWKETPKISGKTTVWQGYTGEFKPKDIPDNHLVGTTGAGPCIIVIVVSPSAEMPRIFVYHFDAGDDPYSTLMGDRRLMAPESHLAIAGGDDADRISMGTLESVLDFIDFRRDIVVDGVYNSPGLWVDNLGRYYESPVEARERTRDGTLPMPIKDGASP